MTNVTDYIPLIRRIARLYHTSFLERDDLVQEACLALLEADAPPDNTPKTTQRGQTLLCKNSEIELAIHRAMQAAIRRYENPAVVRMLPKDLVKAAEAQQAAPAESEPEQTADIYALMDACHLLPRDRQVMVLHYGLDGRPPMSRRNIALQLGISERLVRALIERSLKKLKKTAKK